MAPAAGVQETKLLFDLVMDLAEPNDLAAKYPDVVAELLGRAEQISRSLGDVPHAKKQVSCAERVLWSFISGKVSFLPNAIPEPVEVAQAIYSHILMRRRRGSPRNFVRIVRVFRD